MKKLLDQIMDLLGDGFYDEACSIVIKTLNIEFKCEFSRNDKYINNDGDVRDIYNITLKRGSRSFNFEFGQSVFNSQYYQDTRHRDRTYTLSGGCRTGHYKLLDIEKYMKGGNSLKLIKGKAPSFYDVITCLPFYNPGTFDDFCSDYGLSNDSIKALDSYKELYRQWEEMQKLFNDDELEVLSNIV